MIDRITFEKVGFLTLQHILEGAGFDIIDVYRDYDRNPYNGSGEMIVVARRPPVEWRRPAVKN